jgi:hypothetical protein
LEEDGGTTLPRWHDPADATEAVEALAGLVRAAVAAGRDR